MCRTRSHPVLVRRYALERNHLQKYYLPTVAPGIRLHRLDSNHDFCRGNSDSCSNDHPQCRRARLARRDRLGARQCRGCAVRWAFAADLFGAARRSGRADRHRSAGAAGCASRARDCVDAHARSRSRHGGGGHGRAIEGAGGQSGSLADVRRVRQHHRSRAPLSDVQWRSVHRAPPPLARRSTKSEVFETGIKVIDVLVPLERGGKAGFSAGRASARRCC
jgi:hypothetical protein